jgi:hypothetical protein
VQKKRQFIHRKNFVEVIYRKSSKGGEKQLEHPDTEPDGRSGEEAANQAEPMVSRASA